ncbi:MAG: hypothetical protein SVY10_03770 [Thermodesulfobacteriota bacterium]|nr:hypothetical protein [Thermodesulfobacteriota bacterium]
MKKILIILFLLSAGTVIASDYPKYYERFDEKIYSLIVFHDSKTCTYLSRVTRENGTTWFFYDGNATWGYYPNIEGHSSRPSIWVKTRKFRFDYFEEESNLIEIDKIGLQGKYVRVNNDQ